MTKDELIAKQQLQIEEFREKLEENDKLKREIEGKFNNIGQPLNDNVLMMNSKQLQWCFGVVELVEQINTIEE